MCLNTAESSFTFIGNSITFFRFRMKPKVRSARKKSTNVDAYTEPSHVMMCQRKAKSERNKKKRLARAKAAIEDTEVEKDIKRRKERERKRLQRKKKKENKAIRDSSEKKQGDKQ